MSDYGLLSRKLTLDVEYEDTPHTLAHAKVPVFAVGREQLYQLFGLQGHECPRPDNIYCSLEYSDLEHASYALVCLGGEWSNSYVTLRRMVCLCDVYDSFEQASMHAGLVLGLDAEKALLNPHCYPIYQYEVWQICDDYNLYAHWDMSADRYMRETGQNHKFSQAWRLSYEDNADYQSEIEYQKEQRLSPIRHYFMSNDYLSSLKTYNAHHLESLRQLREAGELERKSRMNETCYFCGCFLPGKNYSVQVGDDMKLACRACFNLYNNDDFKGLRGRTFDTFICDCCGRTMKEKYYVDTSIGVYCSECKAENPDLGEYFVCDRCGKRLSVEHLSHTVSGVYCKHCKSVLCEGLSDCCGDICDPGTFPDPTCHGCEYCNCWSLYYE